MKTALILILAFLLLTETTGSEVLKIENNKDLSYHDNEVLSNDQRLFIIVTGNGNYCKRCRRKCKSATTTTPGTTTPTPTTTPPATAGF